MQFSDLPSPCCSRHGVRLHRASCQECNRAYMAPYQRERRRRHPARTMFERARRRARQRSVPFTLTPTQIAIPRSCPALGVPIVIGAVRSDASPSLDRVQPDLGYVPGNIRVLCDRANRAKSNLSLPELKQRAEAAATQEERRLFGRLATYVERELILVEVRKKAGRPGREGQVWAELAVSLDKLFVDARWVRP